MAEDLSVLSKEELIEKITYLKKQLNDEKYGLYFDRKSNPEKVIEECKTKIPLLKNVIEKRLDYGTSSHLLIEGDNYHALLALQMINPSNGLVDLIYIDPPYNTQNKDFVYNDRFIEAEDNYRHTKWLNFIEKRLLLAKSLLKDDGLFFISIDDNEQANLKLLCDLIFGSDNFVAQFIINKTAQGANQSVTFKTQHEYCLLYSKGTSVNINYEVQGEVDDKKFKFQDEKGFFAVTNSFDSINSPLVSNKNRGYTIYYNERTRDALVIDEYDKETNTFSDFNQKLISEGYTPIRPGIRKGVQFPWNWTSNRFMEQYKQELVFQRNRKGQYNVYHKNRANGLTKDTTIKKFDTRIQGNQLLVDILGEKKFDYPKSLEMMKWILTKHKNKNATILDFFAGSGTTGQAVIELNKEDEGNRKFILVTNNEGNIMTDICYPRLKTVITGTRVDGSKYSEGIDTSIEYFITNFIEDDSSKDQAKYNLVEQCNDLLCVLEDTFVKVEKSRDYYIYKNKLETKSTAIYFNYFQNESFAEMLESVKKIGCSENVIYLFSLNNEIDENEAMIIKKTIKSFEMKPIPSKMYEIYKKIVDDLKRDY
jgi:adenine-specific DNA-methyltransferase